SLSVARNQIPVRPRSFPACAPAKNSSPLRCARVGAIGSTAAISPGSRSSPANRKVTNARRSTSASVFIVEVAKRLALLIHDRAVAIYDHALRPGKVARRLNLVQRPAEAPRFDGECPGHRIWGVPRVAP